MKIKKVLKMKSIFLSAVLISGYFLQSVYASDKAKYGVSPSPTASQEQKPSNELELQKLKKKVSRICRQKAEEQKKEKAIRRLQKRCSPKIREKTDSRTLGVSTKEETATQFSFQFGSDLSALPNIDHILSTEEPTRKLSCKSSRRADRQKNQAPRASLGFNAGAIPTVPNMDYAYPCEPPEKTSTTQDDSDSSLSPFYFSEEFSEKPNVPHNIEPPSNRLDRLSLLPESAQTSSTVFSASCDSAGKVTPPRRRLTRKDTVSRRFQEETSIYGTYENSNLLDIIFIPGASMCCTQFPSPMLVIGINKNFKELLSDAKFEAKAREEIINWTRLHTILEGEDIKDCLANVETIITSTKIFKILNETLGLRRWNTICCDSLSPNSRLSRKSLGEGEIVVSHRPDSSRYTSFDTCSVRLILSYFVDFAKYIELDNGLLYHPLFSNKELTDAIDRLSALLESISYEDDIFAYLDSDGCILKTIMKDTYRNPTLKKIQLLFQEAAQEQSLHYLLRAIGYFNFVRAVKILPFK